MVRSNLLNRIKENPEIASQLNSFSRGKQIPVRVLDTNGASIWQTSLSYRGARFCHLLRPGNNGAQKCHIAYKRMVRESIRWGQAAIGKCCHVFMQIVAPIMDDGKLVGYLIASPFLLVSPSKLQPEELEFLRVKREKGELERALSLVSVIRDDEASRAGEILFDFACKLSAPDLTCLRRVREIQDLQGKIADQICDLKTYEKNFDPGSLTKLSYEQEREIVVRIRLGNREGAKEILYRLLAILLSQYIENFEMLKISVLELMIILTRAAVEAGTKIEEIFGMKYRFVTESANIKDQENLCLWAVQLLDKLTDGIYQTRNVKNYERLKSALDFIESHYQEFLTVEQIAREVYLSPSRLSHIIKDEMGLTLGECISKVRIEKAKSLLRERKISISQVALEVGFPDQSYFTKVFKKVERCTPKYFRQNAS